MMCVYKIENPLGQIYIGQTANYKYRVKQYKNLTNSSQKVKQSFLKYGFENHIFTILKVCNNKDELYENESYYIRKYNTINNGLNMINANRPSKKITCLNDNISITYTLKYQLSFAPNYKWTKCGMCFNTKTNRQLKQVYNSGCIGYCIKGRFYSLKYLRTKLELIPKIENDAPDWLYD